MQRYQVIKQVGDGTYGSVWRAVDRFTNEIVAIKKMKNKFHFWEDCMNLREVKCLQRLSHPSIVHLKEFIWENGELFLVFEYMERNLYQVMKDRTKLLSEETIRLWSFQVLRALDYMHQHGIFHRDLKPENLLVSGDVIKVADFGLAREVYSMKPYTDYVATRWYRAPEVLLQSSCYAYAIDIWAMGAIMAELFTSRPLFPGASEADEIYKICSVLGSPNYHTWPEGMKLANCINLQFPQFAPTSLHNLIPAASPAAINLISAMLTWDPNRRPTAFQLLQHPFFHASLSIPQSTPMERPYVITIDASIHEPSADKITHERGHNASYNRPMQELCLFPFAKLRSSHRTLDSQAFSYPVAPEMVGAPACIKTSMPGVSKHIACQSIEDFAAAGRSLVPSHFVHENEYMAAPKYQNGVAWDLPV